MKIEPPRGTVPLGASTVDARPGHARVVFRRSGTRTVLAEAISRSPARLLSPRNHGPFAWVFLVTLGGGLVDGDRIAVELEVESDALALMATQACTKVYRSSNGCFHELRCRVDEGGVLAILPDPVICFAGASYTQVVDIDLAPGASLAFLDGYTCGRGARGERWQFTRYCSTTTVRRGETAVAVDATRLAPGSVPFAEAMGRFDVVLSLLAIGPKLQSFRKAILANRVARGEQSIAAASAIGEDGAILRVAAERMESAMRALRPSLSALSTVLGDSPFARRW